MLFLKLLSHHICLQTWNNSDIINVMSVLCICTHRGNLHALKLLYKCFICMLDTRLVLLTGWDDVTIQLGPCFLNSVQISFCLPEKRWQAALCRFL